jgi:hypothetical protein
MLAIDIRKNQRSVLSKRRGEEHHLLRPIIARQLQLLSKLNVLSSLTRRFVFVAADYALNIRDCIST